MIKIQTTVFAALLSLLAASGCKSKLEKCMNACEKIKAEDQAACAGNASCLASIEMSFESCSNICEIAMGDGSKRSSSDGTDKSSRGLLPESGVPTQSAADRDEQACEAGNAEACANTGSRIFLGREGRSKDEARGAALLKKACELGSAFGCEIYGRALDDGRGVPKDVPAANSAFTKACDMKAGGGCRSLGLNLPVRDPKRITLLEKACELDDGLGCIGIAAAYLHGDQGKRKDVAKAKTLLQKACTLGQKTACEKLRELP
jgi:TPR repeat protein